MKRFRRGSPRHTLRHPSGRRQQSTHTRTRQSFITTTLWFKCCLLVKAIALFLEIAYRPGVAMQQSFPMFGIAGVIRKKAAAVDGSTIVVLPHFPKGLRQIGAVR